jgi:pimeloyl-ACP methyl ester carboxylesterase
VFLLIPGGSYNRVYWDFPYRPAVYSFNRAMARAGYASFAIDRLGTGASSKPLSWLVTSTTEAGAIHQVVQHLRKTGFDDGGFRTILVGGHSLGSWIGVIEAATFRDVDGVLLTGFGHRFGVTSFLQLAGATYPAFLDPKFSGEGLDPGYVTTQPGTRESAFYAPGRPDPDVVRVDEETKDVASVAELADGLALATLLPYSSAIDVPVLLVVGQSDPYFCGGTASDCSDADTLAAEERPLYGEAPCLAAAVIPDIGHDVNLFPSALGYQALVADWARALVAGGCPGSP